MNFQEWIIQSAWYQRLIKWSKIFVLPGFEGLNAYEVSSFFIKGMKESNLTLRAAAMSFKFFLAVFPGIIFLFTLIAYIPIEDLHSEIISYLGNIMPKEAFSLTQSTIEDLLKNKHSGLLSIGFLITIYMASDGIFAMMQAFNESFHASETRSQIILRLISVMMVFVFVFLLVAASVLIIFSEVAINLLNDYGIVKDALSVNLLILGKWITILLVFLFGTSLIYYLGPVKKRKFKLLSAGTTFASLGVIITSLGFAYYINNFGTYNKLYGSIGTLMVVMLWINFNSIVLLLGFELNATISNIKSQR